MCLKRKGKQSKSSVKYPSAELLQSSCAEDYYRLLDTYDKIYDKINVTFALYTVLLAYMLDKYNFNIITSIVESENQCEFIRNIAVFITSSISIVMIIWSMVQLLLLLQSRKIPVLNTIDIRNDKIYEYLPDEAALWLIDKYTKIVSEMKEINNSRSKQYDSAIIKVVISILIYVMYIILNKGV